jgi:tRNA pseudouridine synthase 10
MATQQIENKGKQILNNYPLCNSCLGRLFRHTETCLANQKIGARIRTAIKDQEPTTSKNCWLCEGLINEINHFSNLIYQELQQYEFTTFLIGSTIDEDILKKEATLWENTKLDTTEPLKMELNREIGRILEKRLQKNVDFKNPDIIAVIDTIYDIVHLQIKPIYLYGRYRKLKRGIPQTKWPCRICRGRGCRACKYSGKMYEKSVEELIGKSAMEQTQATDEAFHGCGREDIDALMLGSGRPFIIELKNPKKRTINLLELEKQIDIHSQDWIEVHQLRYAEKKEISRIKNTDFRKVYRVLLQGEHDLNKEKLKEVAQILRGKTIKQFTPTRVAHRRAKKIRERKIYRCTLKSLEGAIAGLIIETGSGTYIKELVSGDAGKTQPNISELLGVPCTVKELDVLEIKGE